MLDERIITLARKTAGPQLKDLDQPLVLRANANRAKLSGYGHLYSVLMNLYKEEIARRAEIVWRNLHRAHNSFGASLTDTLRADFVETFRVELDAAMHNLRPQFDNDMKGAPKLTKEPDWVSQFGAARDHELARYEGEIDHYVTALETASARGSTPQAAYIFHGHVGAVVTGPNAVTSIVQNIGMAEREELRKALEIVKVVIAQAPELLERDRRELNEIADEAAVEVAKESPNTRRLSLTLQTLASAVQGIASGPGAYEVLRTAAVAIGISV